MNKILQIVLDCNTRYFVLIFPQEYKQMRC